MNYSKGKIFKLLSFLMSFCVLLLLGYWESKGLDSIFEVIIFILVFFFSVLFFVSLHRTGRALSDNEKESPLKGFNPSVLYLRLFKDDEVTSELKSVFGLTEEEQLVQVLNLIGPVVALDSPNKRYSVPGAYRYEISNENWRTEIIKILKVSKLAVLRLGRSNAVDWEIEQVKNYLLPTNIIFIIPDIKKFNYREFASFARNDLHINLPIINERNKTNFFLPDFKSILSIEGFVYFNEDWEAKFTRPVFNLGNWLRSPLMQPGKASIYTALKPVFYNLKTPWKSPMIKFGPLSIIIIFLLVIIFGVLEKT